MEDWAYGVAFDDTKGSQEPGCLPNSKLPFDPEHFLSKDKLNNVRSAVYLVESSNMKAPSRNAHGTDDEVFCSTCIGDGYIPRNIRLMYSFLDLIQPAIIFEKPVILDNRIVISWKVNGCIKID